MNVICFGDSNTYGYDPRGYLGGRYDADNRWVDILAAKTRWTVHNMGQNGREIPSSAPSFPADTDLLIIMLGTNDLLQGRSPGQAVERLKRFLSGISLDRGKLLLIAPPPMALGAWVPSQQLIDNSRVFARLCQTLAERLGIRFADAGKWDIPLAYDGVHFMEQGHKPLLPGFWRRSNKTDFTSFYGPPFTNNRMWRKCLARKFLPAEHPERSQRYNSTQAVILLDARERDEYDSDHIPGVVLSPVGTIDKDTAAEVLSEKGPTVLVYCRGGNRSKTISSTLAKLRYTNIYAFDGINSLIL